MNFSEFAPSKKALMLCWIGYVLGLQHGFRQHQQSDEVGGKQRQRSWQLGDIYRKSPRKGDFSYAVGSVGRKHTTFDERVLSSAQRKPADNQRCRDATGANCDSRRQANTTAKDAPKNRDVWVFKVGKDTMQPTFKIDKNAPFAHPYFWSPFVLIGSWR